MFLRIALLFITVFWVTMNVLLWRSEVIGATELGAAVPTATVWQKILTAPDDSAMEIHRGNARIGFCRWSANVGEEAATGKISTEDFLPEGQVQQLTGYTVDLEGNVAIEEHASRLRFNLHVQFSTNHVWQDFTLRVTVRPSVWEIRALAAQEKVRLKIEDEEGKWERTYQFDELRNPQALLRDLGAPGFLGLLGGQGMILPNMKAISLGLDWEARNDWLKVGHSQVRVYKLQARLLGRYQIAIIVSRVGEILRVKLPENILLVNEALSF